MSHAEDSLPVVHSGAELAEHDGERVDASGVYRAIPAPVKGLVTANKPKTHAYLEMDDGKRVYIEAFGTPQATRPAEELQRFDGHRVTIRGVAHRVMPSPGAGLVAPCVSNVESVTIVNADKS